MSELEYEQFNLTIGSVVGYCWDNLTPRITVEIIWMFIQWFYAFCRGLERVLGSICYLYIAYIDRMVAYIAVSLLGFEPLTVIKNVTNCTLVATT